MNVLIIGGGGREHAIAEAFARSSRITSITVSPGNPGIAQNYPCIKLHTHDDVLIYCQTNAVDYVFIGGEQPVADGMTDYLRTNGIKVIGPSQAAGRIESSKVFSKGLMKRYHIPTAQYSEVHSADEARLALQDYSYPVVLKASGLAAGKGVVIAENEIEAEEAITYLFKLPSEEGLIIEEFLHGWEISLFAICDGQSHCSTVFSQDHKQLYDNDCGPNTGGMGAIAPVEEGEAYRQTIEKEIIEPTLQAMQQEGCPFEGILYLGLMITRDGPKVLEYNCRWGDPEAEVVLPLLETDMLDICEAIDQKKVDQLTLKWSKQSAVTVVLASAGYPVRAQTGFPISIAPGLQSKLYFAGVGQDESGLINTGGRVIMITALGDDLLDARQIAYQDLEKISFQGKYFRHDIGLRSNVLF